MANTVKSRALRQWVAFSLLIVFLTVTHARASDPCPADFKAVEPKPKSVKEVDFLVVYKSIQNDAGLAVSMTDALALKLG